ncbi:DUF3572 domain-containing protein [Salinarimonas soli]|uniref:DUF3572 family protein n=1 Tax=Salinarimonas soli TaxID=1638099 RepID=A0A5B2VX92_9HYPH|nr:DUF3572 domain-containing protein [Salinarimonas soli]KAA2243951.1 DUF3572 family protein [Salinarimonas soli]
MANRTFQKPTQFTDPESLAIEALGFLAGEPQRLMRFLNLTGLEPENVRDAARSPGFLAAVLDYVAGDETLLVACSQALDRTPETIVAAQRALSPTRSEP